PRPTVNSDGDDDLSGGVALGEVPDCVRRVDERVAAVDDRCDGAGLDEPGERLEVFGAILGDQAAQPLPDEDRDQRRPGPPGEAAEHRAPTVLAAGLRSPNPIARTRYGRPLIRCHTPGSTPAARTLTNTSSAPMEGRSMSRSSSTSAEPYTS